MEQVISKIKIIIDSSDGMHSETTIILPKEISDDILCYLIDWKRRVLCTPMDYIKFLEAEKEFEKQ